MSRAINSTCIIAFLCLGAAGPVSLAGSRLPAPATLPTSPPLDFLWPVRSWDNDERHEATALAVSPNAARIAVGGAGTVAVLDRGTGQELWRSKILSPAVAAVHFSSDGKQLIVAGGWIGAGRDGITIIEAGSGKTSSFAGHKYGTRDAVFSPDGTSILSCGGSDYSIEGTYAALWDARTGKPLHTSLDAAGKPERSTQAVVFLPDGERYLTVQYRSVQLHETRNGKLVSQLDDVRASAAAVSPAGACVVLCGDDGLVVWDIAKNESRRITTGQRIHGAAFVSDDLCITWGVELRMWNVIRGDEVSWSGTYESDISVASAAGNYVVASNGRRMQVWGLPGVGTAPPGATPLAGQQPADPSRRPVPPLVVAAERGDAPRVTALLARGAEVDAMRGWKDRSGTTALHVARGYTTALALLDAGADVNVHTRFDWDRTPLHFSVERYTSKNPESLKIIDLLLERGARIEDTFGYDETPLQIAAKAGQKDLADHLIAKGAYYDINSAAALGDVDRVRALLKEKPALALQRGTKTKRNALYWATTTQVIDVLLEAGAQTDIQDAWGATPEGDLRGNRHSDLADYLGGKTR
jgi:hypothetical protein